MRDIQRELGSAEFGIFIGEDEYRGEGLGSEACGLVLNFAWYDLKLKSVFLRVFRNNESAIRSYCRNGFFSITSDKLKKLIDLKNILPDMLFMIKYNPKG